MSRMHRACGCGLAWLALAGCQDDPAAPSPVAGYHRLVSVGGAPVPVYPAPSLGLVPITRGDLLLRADGSFTLGLLGLRSGTWYADGSSFRLVFLTEAEWRGGMDGDSLWVTDVDFWNQRFVFRRARTPKTGVTSGTYVLTSIDGDTIPVSGDGSEGAHIVFDTLTFSERLFFGRHQGERYGSPEDPATYGGSNDSRTDRTTGARGRLLCGSTGQSRSG